MSKGKGQIQVSAINHPKKRAFLAAYAETGNIRLACESAGITRKSHFDWRHSDPEYVRAFRSAKDSAIDNLEAEARRRGERGVRRPVLYQGQQVFVEAEPRQMVPRDPSKAVHEADNPLVPLMVPLYEHEYSDTLLIFLLKAARPKKYRENVKHQYGTRRVRVSVKHEFDYVTFAEEIAAVRREGNLTPGRLLPSNGN